MRAELRIASVLSLVSVVACTEPPPPPVPPPTYPSLTQVWRIQLPGDLVCAPLQLAALADDAIVVQTHPRDGADCGKGVSSTVYRVGPGGIAWQIEAPSWTSVAVASDFTIDLAIGDLLTTTVRRLDANGRELSTVALANKRAWQTPLLAIGPDGDLFVTGFVYTGRFHPDGSRVWLKNIYSGDALAVAGDQIVFATADVYGEPGWSSEVYPDLRVLDAATGEVRWSDAESVIPPSYGDGLAPYADLLIEPDGTIVFATTVDVRAYGPDGAPRWRRSDLPASALALLPSGHLAIAQASGPDGFGFDVVTLVDPATGDVPSDLTPTTTDTYFGDAEGHPDRLATTTAGDLLIADPHTVARFRETTDDTAWP
jgi:hypothetical protein